MNGKPRGILIAAWMALALAALPAVAQSSDAELVRATFDEFREAVVDRRGAAASALVAQGTVDYYERMRELALYATSKELDEQSMLDMMQALLLRLRIPATKLHEMKGRALVAYIFEHGWAKFGMVDLGDVRIEGASAVADAALERSGILAPVRFVKEGEVWRLDLLAIIEAGSTTLDQWHEQSAQPRGEFLLQLLTVGGPPIDDSIWLPPMKR